MTNTLLFNSCFVALSKFVSHFYYFCCKLTSFLYRLLERSFDSGLGINGSQRFHIPSPLPRLSRVRLVWGRLRRTWSMFTRCPDSLGQACCVWAAGSGGTVLPGEVSGEGSKEISTKAQPFCEVSCCILKNIQAINKFKIHTISVLF